MRILSITACLALASLAAAQMNQNVMDASPDAVAREELADAISELEFRATFLESMDSTAAAVSKLEASGSSADASGLCSIDIQAIIKNLDNLIGLLQKVPLLGEVFGPVIVTLQGIVHDLNDSVTLPIVKSALTVLQLIAAMLTNLGDAVSTIVPLIDGVVKSLTDLFQDAVDCLSATNRADGSAVDGEVASALTFQVDQCFNVADLYRQLIEVALKSAPAVPEAASEEMKRSMEGIRAVLDIMAKTSIASANADLLKMRPVFSADVLSQYRDEYMRLAESDEQKRFGGPELTIVIGTSNALEACLRIAKDPVGAIDDLNDELDDFDDEDADEDTAGAGAGEAAPESGTEAAPSVGGSGGLSGVKGV